MTEAPLPTTRRGWQHLIDELGLRPSKGRGQNFLHDISVVHQIVKAAHIAAADHVLEIGPGLGILTGELLSRAGKVSAIELDGTLANHLRRQFRNDPRFDLVQDDALQVDLGAFVGTGPVKVVANLPYSVASAIVQHVLEANLNLLSATVMVQKEVGERIVESPPSMSILSVATQTYAEASIAFFVPPDVFVPPPIIDSAVVQLIPHATPLIPVAQRMQFFHLVNAGFRHKRKNIANSLEMELHLPKVEIIERLNQIGIDPTRRAQTLSVAEWILLLKVWTERDA